MHSRRMYLMLKGLLPVSRLLLLCGVSVLIFSSGCGVTLGPVTERDILFVHYKGVAARVSSKTTAEVEIEKDGKVFTRKMRLDGFYVISPDMKDNGEPVMNKAEAVKRTSQEGGNWPIPTKAEATP